MSRRDFAVKGAQSSLNSAAKPDYMQPIAMREQIMTAKRLALAAALTLLVGGEIKAQTTTEQPAETPPLLEQPAEQPAEPQVQEATPEAKPAVPAEVTEFLSDERPSKSLSDDELRARIERAQALLSNEAVPGDARADIRKRLKRAEAELQQRTAATSEPPAPDATAPAPSTAETDQAPADQPAAEPPSSEVAVLSDGRPSNSLSDEELKARMANALKIINGGYKKKWRRGAMQIYNADNAELQRRAAAANEPPPAPDATPPAPATAEQPPANEPAGDDLAVLGDRRPASELGDEELKARMAVANRVTHGPYKKKVRRAAYSIFSADQAELARRQQVAVTPPAEPAAQPAGQGDQKLDANPVSDAAEAEADQFLRGAKQAAALTDDQLSQRLAAMRDLLQQNKLSLETERRLRAELADEREVLRTRIAEREAKAEAAAAPAQQGKRKRKIDFNTNITVILGDRRPSDELEDEELQRRIDAYREAAEDRNYEAEERDYWRRTMAEDRRALRARMLREREARARDYRRRQARNDDFDIEFDELAPKRPSVWAAESDDEDIEDALVAKPRRKLARRYTIDDIERDEVVRTAMPALEIDTVRFGFNESFLREEEIAHLDRIAEVIEKILAARPHEVFLIEGHTDAVGSDAYNLDLSRKRARAVKEALAAYYVIPSRNLETVGYGERYLRIPTAEPESENRRVSLRRVTPLVGELRE
jgi:outer membrane protein OmpA-like peptidoglycan-associated protein